MTCIFDPMSEKNFILTEAVEWKAKYPYVGDEGKKTLDIVEGWRSGARRTLPDEMPKLLIANKPRKTWPDAFMTTNGLLVVNDSVRAIIEKLDPEIHKFFSLELRTKRGVEIEGPWFAMNVTAKQDSVVMERSNVKINPDFPDTLCSFYADSTLKDVVVDPALQSNLNLWREARFESSLVGSDELIDEFKSRGLAFLKGYFFATNIADLKEV